jgi:tetratricopeptide (TPR) repeat protein
MGTAVVNENEVLTEANRLVAGGLRHAAIDLLQESLDSYPSSPALLRTLGRAYLLSGQPEQAVIYLERSLEASQASNKALQTSPEERNDDFTDDDLEFIDAQAEQQSELDYSPFDATPFSSAKSPLQSSEPPDHEPDSESGDQPQDELLLDAPELGLDLDETESDEDESDYLIESLAPNLDDEETDELAWDDYDDLDEFDEQARRESPVEPQGEGAISREIRARQAAAELLLTCDWHPSTIDLLQQVFVENGWGAARVVIEREIEKGLLPDELALAWVIRGY